MPFFTKSEDWLLQSSLLLEASPQTTRVTTRYHLSPARRQATKKKSVSETTEGRTEDTKPPRGHLVLKTYDPVSGVALKYKTSKAAEVGRLVQMLGTLGRRMAGVPFVEGGGSGNSGEMMEGVVLEGGGQGSGVQTPVPGGGGGASGGDGSVPGAAAGGPGGAGGGGGGKGKKKKGKR
ncbi:signal recognition particle 9 kDa protein-domain-containing protein [Echria macrotheca]|uniref:Signal recognition particle 9 kDa protein-domain-containing protein n=1 Tax=Echria macrotheca TaxID=438768 RepID=A0AAJ0B322_9PEZI|nr:signal recognition particle 9 kDa protein-domain-containing protein [Echria macrotheca]